MSESGQREADECPCATCGQPTSFTATKRCTGCREVENRLADYLRDGGENAWMFVTRAVAAQTRVDAARRLANSRRHWNCECVRLNDEIGITDMPMQERAGRRGLMLGLVSETLSADKSCTVCKGMGRQEDRDE